MNLWIFIMLHNKFLDVDLEKMSEGFKRCVALVSVKMCSFAVSGKEFWNICPTYLTDDDWTCNWYLKLMAFNLLNEFSWHDWYFNGLDVFQSVT